MSTKDNGKGKARARDELDEDGNFTAQESARMIELLDSPVSVQPWQLSRRNGNREREESNQSDGQSGESVEDLLGDGENEKDKYVVSDKLGEDVVGPDPDDLKEPFETEQDKRIESEITPFIPAPELEDAAEAAEKMQVSLEEDGEEELHEEPSATGTGEEGKDLVDLENRDAGDASHINGSENVEAATEELKEKYLLNGIQHEEIAAHELKPLENVIAGDLDITISSEQTGHGVVNSPGSDVLVKFGETTVVNPDAQAVQEEVISKLPNGESELIVVPPEEEEEETAVILEEAQSDDQWLPKTTEEPENKVEIEEAHQNFKESKEKVNEEQQEELNEEIVEAPSEEAASTEGVKESTEQKEGSDDGNSLTTSQELLEEDGKQAGIHSLVNYNYGNADNEDEDDDEDEEDEIVLIPIGTAPIVQKSNDLIDLTESASPEPNLEQFAPIVPPPRRPASGFFANGTLAKEKRASQFELRDSPGSASRVVQQLGQRQVSISSTTSKILNKPSTGFRKKDPIFSKARRSLAKGIVSSKVDELLSSLKRHVKKTLQTPFVDEMLKKRVALAKALADEMPEEEVQIRHLREILKRSESKHRQSLRPARRQLKEQKRLAYEAELSRRRAMGIMGRQPLPKVLPSDQEEFVDQTFKKQGKIAQVVGAAVEARDVAKLRPGVWLNDEVINFYTKLLLNRSDEAIKKRASARVAKKRLGAGTYNNEEERKTDISIAKEAKQIWNGIWNVWTFTSFFYEKLSKGGYSGVRQWTRKVDIFTKDLILLPINIGQAHWVCATINMRLCRFEYYDSMHAPNPSVFKHLRSYLQAEYADKKKESSGPLLLSGWKNYFSRQCPQQENGWDCGVFATMALEQLSRRNPNDGELKNDLNVEKVVQKSRELAEQKGKVGRGSDEEDSSSSEDEEDEEERGDYDEVEEEEWNFSQADIPYLRRRMVFEIANSNLLNE